MPTTPTEPAPELSPAMTALQKAGAKLARANASRDRAIAELRDAIRAADAEPGNTRTQIQEVAGVARQTVYDALRDTTPAAPAVTTPTGNRQRGEAGPIGEGQDLTALAAQ